MPIRRFIDVSVDPYEIVLGSPRLEVKSRSPLDPETARGALGLGAHRSTVTLSDDGLTATAVPEGDLPPGPHTLIVEELVSTKGKRLTDRLVLPFFVSDSRAKVKSSLRIESLVRLRVERLGTVRLPAPKRPDGSFIEIMKAVDRSTGKPVELAFDQDGARVNPDEVFAEIVRNRQKSFGKLHPTLQRAIKERRDERLPVAVWVQVPPAELHAKREKGATGKPPPAETERARRHAKVAAQVAEILREHGGEDPRPDPHAPVVYAELPAENIRRLQERKEITALFLHETEGEVDLSNSMAIAQSDTVQSSLSLTGSGVNVAVYEDGPDSTANLSITASFTSSPATDQHAASHPRDHQEHRGQQAARARVRVQPALGQHDGARGDHVGGAHPRLHGDQSELPPQRRADGLRTVVRRHVQGLAGSPLAVPDDPPGGWERNEHGVRQPQGLQHLRSGKSQRRGLRDGQRLRLPKSSLPAQRQGIAGGRGEWNGRDHGRV